MTLHELSALYFNTRAQRLARPESFDSRIAPALDQFGHLQLEQITSAKIEDWRWLLERPRLIHGAKRKPRTSTVNRAIAELSRVLRWGVMRGHLAAVPLMHWEAEDNQRSRRVSEAEEDQLLRAAQPHLRGLIIVAFDTGMRAGEMMQVEFRDVDLDRSLITVRGVTAKSGKTRFLPVNTVRLRSVFEWLLRRAVPKVNPCVLQLANFRAQWEQVVKDTQLPDLKWHDLRHEFASRLAERGIPITEIQRLLGHASVKTTERYINHTIAQLSKSATVLEQGKEFIAV